MKLNKQLVGIAGEYFVAAELSRRGYLAAITLRNSDGVDILTSDLEGNKKYAIQVKTTQNKKKWVLSHKVEQEVNKDKYFVFVSIPWDITEPPEYMIIKGSDLGEYISNGHRQWLITPGKNGKQRNETNLREFNPKYIDAGKILNWNSFFKVMEGNAKVV